MISFITLVITTDVVKFAELTGLSKNIRKDYRLDGAAISLIDSLLLP